MGKYNYQTVSTRAMLRDWVSDLRYIDDKHKMLVDIADTLYNVCIPADMLKPEYKALYDEYGEDYFADVVEDMCAIDTQLNINSVDNLVHDYLYMVADYEYQASKA